MASRADLPAWVVEALEELGGSGHVNDVAEVIWRRHEPELRVSGGLFFSWQYDMRWAATRLRGAGKLVSNTSKEPWKLTPRAVDLRTRSEVRQQHSPVLPAAVGDIDLVVHRQYARAELTTRFRGQGQSGIVTPKGYPIILLYSSPRGEEYGYQDEWESELVYLYYGQGQKGDMEFKRGNKAIKNSAIDKKTVYLLKKRHSKDPSYRLEGIFVYDSFDWCTQDDPSGGTRRAIRFRLRRVD